MNPLQSQIFPTINDFKSLGDLGYLVVIALVAFILAVVILLVVFVQFRQATARAKSEEKEDSRIDKLIDRLVEIFSTLNAEQGNSRKVISENSETQRLVVVATNEQTSEVKLLRADFKNYQSLQSDTVHNLREEMVSFKGEVQGAIDKMLGQISTTNEFVERAVSEHQIIIAASKDIMGKVDEIIARLSPIPPANVVNINTAPPTADGEAA